MPKKTSGRWLGFGCVSADGWVLGDCFGFLLRVRMMLFSRNIEVLRTNLSRAEYLRTRHDV